MSATKIMVVDDDPGIRQLLDMVLGLEGFDIVGLVSDGALAVDVALESQPDVVILDYMMPNLNGADAATFLREVAPEARIIAFSGGLSECPDWADDFLMKGGVNEIVTLIQRVMSNAPDAARAKETPPRAGHKATAGTAPTVTKSIEPSGLVWS